MGPGHQRVDPLDVLRRRPVLLADTNIDQGGQGCPQGDSDSVQTVNRDRLLAPLDLPDELPTQSRELAEPVLGEPAFLAQRP